MKQIQTMVIFCKLKESRGILTTFLAAGGVIIAGSSIGSVSAIPATLPVKLIVGMILCPATDVCLKVTDV